MFLMDSLFLLGKLRISFLSLSPTRQSSVYYVLGASQGATTTTTTTTITITTTTTAAAAAAAAVTNY